MEYPPTPATSYSQIEILLEYTAAPGKRDSLKGRAQVKRQWAEIAGRLNSLGKCIKSGATAKSKYLSIFILTIVWGTLRRLATAFENHKKVGVCFQIINKIDLY